MKFHFAPVAAGLTLATNALALAIPLELTLGGKPSADVVAQIAPTSVSCEGADDDCRTNVQSGPLLAKAMCQYGLNNVENYGRLAAVLALTAFESVGYKFKRNVSKNEPGQGTSNMQMFNYNLQYAKTFDELKPQVQGVDPNTQDPAVKNMVRDLVKDDKYNFGSGPWFLTSQCPDAFNALIAGPGLDDGFAQYMACVDVEIDEDRRAYWTRAKQAVGLE
ncbi:hypothetical protein F4779DRAFT_262957 [Xylariaceae sp. FL0662B]|nr:hypothetical protein F4779DRAFT_262957 [Xylariaceae sp. FL0662B]